MRALKKCINFFKSQTYDLVFISPFLDQAQKKKESPPFPPVFSVTPYRESNSNAGNRIYVKNNYIVSNKYIKNYKVYPFGSLINARALTVNCTKVYTSTNRWDRLRRISGTSFLVSHHRLIILYENSARHYYPPRIINIEISTGRRQNNDAAMDEKKI